MEDHNKNITNIQKQLTALESDDSEEAISKKQQLQTQLEEARKNQEEEMYSKYLEDQNKALDLLFENYEKVLNERLDNIDGLVTEMIQSTNQNAADIQNTITAETDKVGYDITEGMKNIWDTESSEIQKVVTEYNANFTATLTTTNKSIQEIRDLVKKSIEQEAELLKPDGTKGDPNTVSPPKPSVVMPSPAPAPAPSKPSSGSSSGSGGGSGNSGGGKSKGWFFKYKLDSYPKSRLNRNTSIIDRLKYHNYSTAWSDLAYYYEQMNLGSRSSYCGSYNQNVQMLNYSL